MIPSQRHLFDIPDDVAYLNCAYLSPLSHAVLAAGEEGLRMKALPWTVTPPDFFSESEIARKAFADLIGAQADDIFVIPAASYGVSLAAANLPVGADQKIIMLEEQFPSHVYPWRELAARTGAAVEVLPRPADEDWTTAILAAIDDRCGIVAVPHCHWTDGGLIDLVAVGERCRAAGAALVIDATQSLGALPLDVREVQPDFLIAACYKWLLGPYSIGFAYAAPHRQDGQPLEYNWIQREDAENFAGLVNYGETYQTGARRYDVGERSNFALMPAARAALDQIAGWGVEEIQATLSARTADIAERARDFGLSSAPQGLRAGHFLGLRFSGGVPGGLPETLAENKVFVSVRGSSMRITPHVYNTDADVDKLFDILGSALG